MDILAGCPRWRLLAYRSLNCKERKAKRRGYLYDFVEKKIHTVNSPKRKYVPLAQLVEQLTLNQWVQGSNP